MREDHFRSQGAQRSKGPEARAEASPLGAERGATGNDLGREAISRLQHSLSLAVEALGPFAHEYGDGIPRPNDFQITGNLTLGDFRRAREVHSKLTESE